MRSYHPGSHTISPFANCYKVMEELDYRPQCLAKALKTKQTRIIALLFPSLRNDLSQLQLEFVNSALERASEQKYSLLLSILPIEDQKIMHFIEPGFVDGVVLMGVKLHDARVELLRKRKYPFSMIGHCADTTGLSFVDLDFEKALSTCLHYLADLGHRHIAFLNEAQTLLDLEFGVALRAKTGFVQAITERGLQGFRNVLKRDAAT